MPPHNQVEYRQEQVNEKVRQIEEKLREIQYYGTMGNYRDVYLMLGELRNMANKALAVKSK